MVRGARGELSLTLGIMIKTAAGRARMHAFSELGEALRKASCLVSLWFCRVKKKALHRHRALMILIRKFRVAGWADGLAGADAVHRTGREAVSGAGAGTGSVSVACDGVAGPSTGPSRVAGDGSAAAQ